MAWYQCSCGVLKEISPQLGETITSVNHLHRSARLDGTATIVRMQEITVPIPVEPSGRGETAQYRPAA
jgi:hypothetical protein